MSVVYKCDFCEKSESVPVGRQPGLTSDGMKVITISFQGATNYFHACSECQEKRGIKQMDAEKGLDILEELIEQVADRVLEQMDDS